MKLRLPFAATFYEAIIMKRHYLGIALFAIGFGPVIAAPSPQPHWSYTSPTGPDEWGDLHDTHALCNTGTQQSPINIKANTPGRLPALDIHYPRGPAVVKHNGHTLEVTPESKGYMTLPSGNYDLVQMHFHAPAEMQIEGHKYPFSAHLVHRDAAGNLAVIALLFDVGAKNKVLAPLFSNMPRHEGDAVTLRTLDLKSLFPAKLDYFTFMGSLTTPPCTEGVLWQVFKVPGTISKQQLKDFKQLFPMNARPIQPSNDRAVKFGS